MVFIGFESASDRILSAMDKGTTNKDNVKCARALEQALFGRSDPIVLPDDFPARLTIP